MMVFRYEYENATVVADGNAGARKRFLGQDGSFEDQFEINSVINRHGKIGGISLRSLIFFFGSLWIDLTPFLRNSCYAVHVQLQNAHVKCMVPPFRHLNKSPCPSLVSPLWLLPV